MVGLVRARRGHRTSSIGIGRRRPCAINGPLHEPGCLCLLDEFVHVGEPAGIALRDGDPIDVGSVMVNRRRHTNKEAERPKKEAERRVNIPRGSASFVPPISSVTPLTPLISSPPPAAAYNPPPVSNPSERITQFNQSFQFNKGLGNNPTDRDAYVRYNFNR
jgi:hypothetical protein